MAAVSVPMTAYAEEIYAEVHRKELTEQLDSLRKLDSFCNVTILVKGQEFKAHKVVLAAASPFFRSLLKSNMRESNEQLIRIELEEATASVMEDVLKYVYTGNVSVTEESSHNLIATADYLVLPCLKIAVCDFLTKNVTIENCVFYYYFAEKYQCAELKEKCVKEINSNFSVVTETDDFLSLGVDQVMAWVSSDDLTVSAEEEVFKGIVKWVSHNRSERESCFPDLLRQVRLISMSHDFLLNALVKEELITGNNECLNFVLGSMKWIFGSTGKNSAKPPRNYLNTQTDGIFVCGGKKALCYLPHEDAWYQLVDMTLEHQEHSATQYKDRVYIFSQQRVVSGQSQVAEYYMSSNNSWGAIQTNFEYDEQFSSLLVLNDDSTLYALTNCTEDEPENTIFAYNPVKNEWEIVGDDALDRWGACGVTDGHHLYIMGGTNNDNEDREINAIAKVERIDPCKYSREEIAAMNEARHEAFGAAMNGKIYVAGGLQKNGPFHIVLNTCEVYDPPTNEWQLMPDLKVPRYAASMVCYMGVLYVLGGLKDTSKSRELSVEMFDSGSNEWKEKSTIPVNNESQEEVHNAEKEIHYKACFATIHKAVLKNPVNL